MSPSFSNCPATHRVTTRRQLGAAPSVFRGCGFRLHITHIDPHIINSRARFSLSTLNYRLRTSSQSPVSLTLPAHPYKITKCPLKLPPTPVPSSTAFSTLAAPPSPIEKKPSPKPPSNTESPPP